MNDEMAELKTQLSNARSALYFAKRDHEREMAELKNLKARDEAHIVECHSTIAKLLGSE